MGWFPLKMCEDKHSSNSRHLFYSFLVVIAWTYLQPHYDNGCVAMFTFQLDKTNCWHPIAVMGVVDTFGHYLRSLPVGSSVFAIAIFWFDLNTVWTLKQLRNRKSFLVPALKVRQIRNYFLSQCFFQKKNKQIQLYYLAIGFHLFLGRKWRHKKSHFEINWPLVETLSCRKRWLICETNCVNRVQCGLVCHWKNVKRKCDLQKKPKIVTSFRRKKKEPPGPN